MTNFNVTRINFKRLNGIIEKYSGEKSDCDFLPLEFEEQILEIMLK